VGTLRSRRLIEMQKHFTFMGSFYDLLKILQKSKP
jgi:hypothetical protein